MGQYSGMWTLSQASQAVKNQTWTGIAPTVVEYLVVAGGGSGGSNVAGGGGGQYVPRAAAAEYWRRGNPDIYGKAVGRCR